MDLRFRLSGISDFRLRVVGGGGGWVLDRALDRAWGGPSYYTQEEEPPKEKYR